MLWGCEQTMRQVVGADLSGDSPGCTLFPLLLTVLFIVNELVIVVIVKSDIRSWMFLAWFV